MKPVLRTTTMMLAGLALLSPQVIFAAAGIGTELVKAAHNDESAKLAALAQNPIAAAISVPLQYNYNMGYGPNHDTDGVIFNVQPVIPFKLGDNWNLITRTIIPVVDLPVNAAGDKDNGIGDISLSLFASPSKKSGKWIWGAGIISTFDTASHDTLGTGKTLLGPAFIALSFDGPWVYGALLNNQWDVGGDGDRDDVNTMLFNPFLNYNIPNAKGWYLSFSPNITANWESDSDRNKWVVPLGGGVGKVFKIGTQACNAKLSYYNNIQTPVGGADDSLQLQFAFLFPK